MCGESVEEASMGGTVICPACDCGKNKDGSNWTLEDAKRAGDNYKENSALCETCKNNGACNPHQDEEVCPICIKYKKGK